MGVVREDGRPCGAPKRLGLLLWSDPLGAEPPCGALSAEREREREREREQAVAHVEEEEDLGI